MFKELHILKKIALFIGVASFWILIPTGFIYGLLTLSGNFTGTISVIFYVVAGIWAIFCLWYTYKEINAEDEYPSNIKPPELDKVKN